MHVSRRRDTLRVTLRGEEERREGGKKGGSCEWIPSCGLATVSDITSNARSHSGYKCIQREAWKWSGRVFRANQPVRQTDNSEGVQDPDFARLASFAVMPLLLARLESRDDQLMPASRIHASLAHPSHALSLTSSSHTQSGLQADNLVSGAHL